MQPEVCGHPPIIEGAHWLCDPHGEGLDAAVRSAEETRELISVS